MVKKDLEGCRKIMKAKMIPVIKSKVGMQVATSVNKSIQSVNAGILKEKTECEKLFGAELSN